MDDFLKSARKHLEEIDLEKMLKDVDLSRIDKKQLKQLEFSDGAKKLRKQLQQLEGRQREEEAASEGFLGGVLLGVVVGAVLALIFAPRPGRETREMVAGTASELMHKAEGLVSQSGGEGATDSEPDSSTLPSEPAIERDFGTEQRPNSTTI